MAENFCGYVANCYFVTKHLRLPVIDLRMPVIDLRMPVIDLRMPVIEITLLALNFRGGMKSAKVSCHESIMLYDTLSIALCFIENMKLASVQQENLKRLKVRTVEPLLTNPLN